MPAEITTNSRVPLSDTLARFTAEVMHNVRGHEEHLRRLKRWAGKNADAGCWGSAAGMVGQLEKTGIASQARTRWPRL